MEVQPQPMAFLENCDMIWQRTAQDRLTWRRHAEAFAQPQDNTRLPNDYDNNNNNISTFKMLMMMMMMLIMDDVVVLVRASPAIYTVQICSLHELYFGNSRFISGVTISYQTLSN